MNRDLFNNDTGGFRPAKFCRDLECCWLMYVVLKNPTG